MKQKICLLGLLCLFFHKTNAQKQPIIRPLKIGDTIPALTFKNILNYKSSTFDISEFRGKVLILDFWASYCGSCLEHFPAADSIQKVLPNKVQILLVNSTRDNKERVLTVLKRFQNFKVPTVVGDTILDRLFTHFSIPHYVWIDQAGVVRAFTSGEELTVANVKRFINSGELPTFEKNDFDSKRPLYTVKELPVDHLQQYSIFLKGKIDGIGGGGLRVINDTTRGVILHNRSLLWMYESVLFNKISGFSDNRLILDVKDSSKFLYINKLQSKDQWERVNFYSYELIVPSDHYKNIYDYVLGDLNRYTPYDARFEKENVKCWILRRSDSAIIIPSKGGEYTNLLEDTAKPRLINAGLLDLCTFINKITDNSVILDETGYTGNIDLSFDGPIIDPKILVEKLKPFGLKLVRAERNIDMLVIRDKISN